VADENRAGDVRIHVYTVAAGCGAQVARGDTMCRENSAGSF